MTAYPDVFRCGGLLNGGAGYKVLKRWKDYLKKDITDIEKQLAYKTTVANLDSLVKAGNLPDQKLIGENAAYAYGDKNDGIITADMVKEQVDYLKSFGAKVEHETVTGDGHVFETMAPKKIAKACYEALDTKKTVKDYTFDPK